MKTKIIAILIAVVVLAGVGSAALLDHYAMLDGKAVELQQSIVVDENDYDVVQEYEITNETPERVYQNSFTVENRAELPGYVKFATDYHGEADTMTTRYLGKVVLDNKGSDWGVISDGTTGILTYELNNNKFVFNLTATGLAGSTSYSLIYYADQIDRFGSENWGGISGAAGTVIASKTTNAVGEVRFEESPGERMSVGMSMDIPHVDDWNCGDKYNSDYTTNDYGLTPDSYDMRTGGKMWLVPTAVLTAGDLPLTSWGPGAILFETDLINYDDTNAGVNGLRIGAYSSFELIIETEFEMDAAPDTYTVTTTIIPA